MVRFAGQSSRLLATVILSLALCATGIWPSPAHALPVTPEITQKQAEAASARAELERMHADLEVTIEEFNAITEAVERTEGEISLTREDLKRATAELKAAEDVLSGRVAGMYKHGGLGVADVFLGIRSFDDLITRFDLLRRIGASDAATVESVQSAKARVEAAERALEQRRSEQLVLQKQAADRAAAIEDQVTRQQGYVARLDADVQQLIAREEERERARAEERARQAAAAQRALEQSTPPSPAAPGGQQTPGGGTTPGAPSAGGVVGIALQYLGVPYVWGGSSPSGFDCSGLVQYVYRQVGVSLPRTSQAQFRVGQHIPADRVDLLQPGDLVFFGTNGDPGRVHHVGIYVGGGDYVHAPYTGTVVRINSLTGRIQSRQDYVGGSRI